MSPVTKSNDRFLFGAAVGAGMTALAAERGGADFLIILNAGRLRLQGASSLSCYLPLRNSNEWVMKVAREEILNKCKLPVFMGASACDPTVAPEKIIGDAQEIGFSGIVNFPSAWAIEGRMREAMEREGIGFNRECALIEHASKAGMSTLAYVKDNDDAVQMTDAGADQLCAVLGFTGGATGVENRYSIETAAETVDHTLRNVPSSTTVLVEGGPIATPEDALALSRLCRIGGYIAGSTIDRLPLEETIEQVVKSYKVISRLGSKSISDEQFSGLDGSSEAIATINQRIERAARTNLPILISGSSGTGKSKLARNAHALAPLSLRNPVTINCNNLQSETAASILFGTAAGQGGRGTAASGGILETANQTSIIFEEISALDLETQGMLLDFFETGQIQRLGSATTSQIDTRIIATTTRDLNQMVANGEFRADLYYRLAVHHITIPDLSERPEDIPLIAGNMLQDIEPVGDKQIGNSAFTQMISYSWPGNVRELKNALVRALSTSKSKIIPASAFSNLTEDQISPPPHKDAPFPNNQDVMSATIETDAPNLTERDWIAASLRRNRYKKAETAKELGMTTRTLYNKIKKYELY